MDIITALKKEDCIRISYGDKWLVWVDKKEGWNVYQRKYGAKKSVILCRTHLQKEAVKILLEE